MLAFVDLPRSGTAIILTVVVRERYCRLGSELGRLPVAARLSLKLGAPAPATLSSVWLIVS
jgi:hypothetical protein